MHFIQKKYGTLKSGYQMHSYLAHTTYWVHAVFLKEFVYTLDKKHTALNLK